MATKAELLGQVRFVASASRPLVREKHTTALGALDTLQKISERWDWLWLAIVCADGEEIAVGSPFADAVAFIAKHGGAVGIVGAALIDRQFRFLKKPLKRGVKVGPLLERSAKAAEERVWDDVRKSISRVLMGG